MAEKIDNPQSLPEKRKPNLDFLEGEGEPKKIKHDPEILNSKHLKGGDDDEDDNFEEEAKNKVDDEGKGFVEAIDKGEEEIVMKEESEVDSDSSDRNFDNDDMVGEYGEDESDLDDVPLIEVYFINILRSQT